MQLTKFKGNLIIQLVEAVRWEWSNSRRNLVFRLMVGFWCGALFGGILGLFGMLEDQTPEVMDTLVSVLFLGYYFGELLNGGIAIFKQFTLRFLLYCNGFAPSRYVSAF